MKDWDPWDNNAQFVSLISFLLERGSNPNILRDSNHHLPAGMVDGGTAMDMFASSLSIPGRNTSLPTSGARVCDKIASQGGEFSRHLTTTEHIDPKLRCKNFPYEIDELNMFPEQFES